MSTVSLDLRRDLPKVRRQYEQVLDALSVHRCVYKAPCVVGAMVPQSKRAMLDDSEAADGNTAIEALIRAGVVKVPAEQKLAFKALQKAFDSGDRQRFEASLKRAERKWLASGMSASGQDPQGLEAKPASPAPLCGETPQVRPS